MTVDSNTDFSTTAVSSPPAKCSACQGPLASPVFCDHCRQLLPAEGLHHFALFGLPVAFAVDSADLRQRYLQLSRLAHPDRQTGDAEGVSLRLSAQINEAYRILSVPVLRAEYLLELRGGKAAAEDRAVLDGVLPETLMLREEIAEARTAGHEAALGECRRRVRERLVGLNDSVAALAAELPGDEALRARLRATLNSLKYFQRLESELQPG